MFAKLSRRASFINPEDMAGLKLSPGKGGAAPSVSTIPEEDEAVAEFKESDAEPAVSKPATPPRPRSAPREAGPAGPAQLDPAITQLLYSMHERLANLDGMSARIEDLSGTVNNLAAQVDSMSRKSREPVLMVPQQVNVSMSQGGRPVIQDYNPPRQQQQQKLTNRASRPILMVPQMGGR